MSSKRKAGKIQIDFPSEKLRILTFCMEEKGLDFDEAVRDFVSGLYVKHVPKLMKSYLGREEKTEEKSSFSESETQFFPPKGE